MDSGRRVLIYAMNFAPELIGCGRYTSDVSKFILSFGGTVEVITTPPHYPGWQIRPGFKAHAYSVEKDRQLKIYRCPIVLSRNMKGFGRAWAPISFAISSGPLVLWRILRFRPHQILCIEPTLFAAPIALFGARLIGAKTHLHIQDFEIEAAFAVGHIKANWLRKFLILFDDAITGSFNSVITISNKMLEKAHKKGVKAERLHLVRNWVDISKLFPMNHASTFRKELGLGDDMFVALYAGNVGLKQALHLILDAASFLKDSPQIIFVIAGDGPEKASLVERNIPNVRFLPLQPEGKLNDLLNLADVHLLPQSTGIADLVLPSKLGGMLASGKPIIAMADRDTEIYDFLSEEALLTPTGDAAAFADAVRKIATQGFSKNSSPENSKALKLLSEEKARSEFGSILELG